ncbi:MAG: DNA polymerase III subunit alpha [Enterobacterales bacterium]
MKNIKYIHLHVHSDYSMIDSLIKIDKLITYTKKINMPSIALTDLNNLFGLIKFYKLAYKKKIKPIVGIDVLVKNSFFSKNIIKLTILAKNNVGYKNLINLTSNSYKRRSINNSPILEEDWLIKYNKGLIILSEFYDGDIGKDFIQNNCVKIIKYIDFYKKYFDNNYYLELLRIGRPKEEQYINKIIDLSIKYDLPIVATNNVRFISKSDFYNHEIRVSINKRFYINDKGYVSEYTKQQYMKNEKEMCELFSDLPSALVNSVEIAKRCNVILTFDKYFLPKFNTGNISVEKYITNISIQGLKNRLINLFTDKEKRNNLKNKYFKRLNYELKIINEAKFPSYFLIVMDFIQWAKNNNIPVGPGRGSGAGSLVAYALNITNVDPVHFNLFFERFLNPERISMPDFDIDFCMESRDRVIKYVTNKYGINSVAQIITFGTLTARSVVRDVGRALGYPYNFVDKIAKLIPFDPGITLKKAFYIEKKLQYLYEKDEEIKVLIDISRKLEGIIKNVGKHAGGVVISPTSITDFAPIYCDSTSKNIITQFDKNDLESVGLIKFDFLGLRTLTTIKLALNIINNNRLLNNLNLININNINLDDKKIFKELKLANTTGIFQLDSKGMKNLIIKLKPDKFEDLIALVALFRPGPLQSGMVKNFINRKNGLEKIHYPDPRWEHSSLKSVLNTTYGVILYQEQVIQIAQILAGYTTSSADLLRQSMANKDPKEMKKQRLIFKQGASNLGIDSKLSTQIFNLVEKFSGYGFNKSHSTAYALITYQTLWLKVFYTSAFMAASLTTDIDNTDKVSKLIFECLRIGIKVLQPNINKSEYGFIVNQKNEIVFGIGAIKGIGINSINEIMTERNRGGNFINLFDLCIRVNLKKINKKVLENLIMSGALDCFNKNRSFLMNILSDTIKFALDFNKNKNIGQYNLFKIKQDFLFKKKLYKINNWTHEIQLDNEIKALGFNLIKQSISQYLEEISRFTNLVFLKNINNYANNNEYVTIAGIIIYDKTLINKYKQTVILYILHDKSNTIEILVNKKIFDKYKTFLKNNNIVIIYGKVITNKFNNRNIMLAYKIIDIHKMRIKYAKRLIISLDENTINDKLIDKIGKILKQHSSNLVQVIFKCKLKNLEIFLCSNKNWNIFPTELLINSLSDILGYNAINLEFNH